VIIGFFNPITCDLNGFQLAGSDMVQSSLSFALYLLFFTAVVGLILGVILMLNKKIPGVVDWVVILLCLCSGLIPLFMNWGEYEYQVGFYLIMVGYAAILVTQIVSLIKKET
jgi:hypothetical protein